MPITISEQSEPDSRSRDVKRPAIKSFSPLSIILAIVGWGAFFGGIVAAVKMTNDNRYKIAAMRAEHEAKVSSLQSEIDEATEQFTAANAALAARMEEINAMKSQLNMENVAMARELTRLDETKSQLAEKKKIMTSQSAAVADEADLARDGQARLRERHRAMQEAKQKMINTYRQNYNNLRDQLTRLVDRGGASQLRGWYNMYSHTPFAAVACLAAAEKFYEEKKSKDALLYYQMCIDKYPGSGYDEKCESRIMQIKNREGYRQENFSIIPYAPFDLENVR